MGFGAGTGAAKAVLAMAAPMMRMVFRRYMVAGCGVGGWLVGRLVDEFLIRNLEDIRRKDEEGAAGRGMDVICILASLLSQFSAGRLTNRWITVITRHDTTVDGKLEDAALHTRRLCWLCWSRKDDRLGVPHSTAFTTRLRQLHDVCMYCGAIVDQLEPIV